MSKNEYKLWSAKDEAQLTEFLKTYRGSVNSFALEFASLLKKTPSAIRAKLANMQVSKIPQSNHKKWNNHLTLDGDFFVLMDAHFPYHDADFINRCLAVCRKYGIKRAILGGDALDFHALNQFAQNFADEGRAVIDNTLKAELMQYAEKLPAKYRAELQDKLSNADNERGNLSEEIRESRVILKAFEDCFDNIVWIMGNHEQRVTRILQNVMEAATVARLFGADNPKWQVSGYFWCEVNSGGIKWQVEHPQNSAKHSSKKLAPKYQCNIIMGHNHHFSVTTDPSGEYIAIEPGMGADESRMDYVMQRHNAADTHVNGAVILRNGRATLLNKFSDWEML